MKSAKLVMVFFGLLSFVAMDVVAHGGHRNEQVINRQLDEINRERDAVNRERAQLDRERAQMNRELDARQRELDRRWQLLDRRTQELHRARDAHRGPPHLRYHSNGKWARDTRGQCFRVEHHRGQTVLKPMPGNACRF